MPQGLDRGDRALLIGTGVLLVILVLAATLVSPPQTSGRISLPSSYSPDWNGAEAAFLVLQDLGYDVERWEKSPVEITDGPANTVLVLVDPVQPPAEDERAAIASFLEEGGRVFATGESAAMLLPRAEPFTVSYDFDSPEHFSPQAPSPIMRGAPDITMFPPESWSPDLPGEVIVYGDRDTAAVVTYRFGKGEVVWWAAATPLTNGAIRDASNLQLFLNSVAPSREVHILWDEYFHGAHGSLWSYLQRTPLAWGLAQFGLVFLAILFTYSRRSGPVRAPATVSRLSPLEFVDTLGDLYNSVGAGAAAVQIANQRLRFLLTRRLGLAANISNQDLARRASQKLGWEEEPLLEALVAVEKSVNVGKRRGRESLKVVQQLFDYAARLEMRGARKQEDKRDE
jgi:Domain of unknown function (DUF4350)